MQPMQREFSGNDAQVSIVIADTEGNFTWLHDEPIEVTVPGGSHLQFTKIFEDLNAGDTSWQSIQAFVQVVDGGSVYAYATVIDNKSGDATKYLTAIH